MTGQSLCGELDLGQAAAVVKQELKINPIVSDT